MADRSQKLWWIFHISLDTYYWLLFSLYIYTNIPNMHKEFRNMNSLFSALSKLLSDDQQDSLLRPNNSQDCEC